MDISQLIQGFLQGNSSIFAVLSILFSLVALVVSLRSAYNDRVSVNSWEAYNAYNSEPVRLGRALTLRIKHETGNRGLPTYADYRKYFGLDSTMSLAPMDAANQQAERQYFHDLAAFYHQVGLLLSKRHLDSDFTLMLIGPGLEDRWTVIGHLAGYYTPENGTDFPYGGMYVLYHTYTNWKHSRLPNLHKQFALARAQVRSNLPSPH